MLRKWRQCVQTVLSTSFAVREERRWAGGDGAFQEIFVLFS